MASIVPIIIGCIDYLAYGTIFMCALFRPKKNLMFFVCQKAQDERWEKVCPQEIDVMAGLRRANRGHLMHRPFRRIRHSLQEVA